MAQSAQIGGGPGGAVAGGGVSPAANRAAAAAASGDGVAPFAASRRSPALPIPGKEGDRGMAAAAAAGPGASGLPAGGDDGGELGAVLVSARR